VNQLRGGADKQGIAIGRGVADILGRAHAGRGAVVFHDDALAQKGLQRLDEDARHHIGIAAATLGHDEPDGSGSGPFGGMGRARQERQERGGQCRPEQSATMYHISFHGFELSGMADQARGGYRCDALSDKTSQLCDSPWH